MKAQPTSPGGQPGDEEDAQAARLLERNLKRIPAERVEAHERAMKLALVLREAVQNYHARHGEADRKAGRRTR
jgi:hypothetical protein